MPFLRWGKSIRRPSTARRGSTGRRLTSAIRSRLASRATFTPSMATTRSPCCTCRPSGVSPRSVARHHSAFWKAETSPHYSRRVDPTNDQAAPSGGRAASDSKRWRESRPSNPFMLAVQMLHEYNFADVARVYWHRCRTGILPRWGGQRTLPDSAAAPPGLTRRMNRPRSSPSHELNLFPQQRRSARRRRRRGQRVRKGADGIESTIDGESTLNKKWRIDKCRQPNSSGHLCAPIR
jgi:hypothetical protein